MSILFSFTNTRVLKFLLLRIQMSLMAVCQRSLLTSVKQLSKLTNLQKVATEGCSVGHQLYLGQICAGYTTNEPTGFDNKNKILPYPHIESILRFEPETFRLKNYKQVKYGDYVFKECAEGFVHVYVHGYKNRRDPLAPAGYGVCFGQNHPLNASGLVERKQSERQAKLCGFIKAINLVPKDLKIQKLCVCLNQELLIEFLSEDIPRLSENSFRTASGHLHTNSETIMEIYNLLRSRQDITKLRLRYMPCHVWNVEIYQALKMARKTAMEAEKLLKY